MKTLFDYENFKILGKGVMQAHTTLIPYKTVQQAKSENREASNYFMLLSGEWNFKMYPRDIMAENFEEESFCVDSWDKINVPGCWQCYGYGQKNYVNFKYPFPVNPPYIPRENPVGCYRHCFTVPKTWDDKEIHIVFDGVCSLYRVWINGAEIGFSQGSYLPGEFDITPYLKKGENVLGVMVYQWSWGSYLENQDMCRYNGIFRDVYLLAKEEKGIEDILITSDLDNEYKNGTFKAEITGNYEACEVILLDNENVLYSEEKKLVGKEQFVCEVNSPRKWSSENPYLYQVYVILKKQGVQTECYKINTGFVKIEIKNGKFLVNGNPIKIKGVNRHDTHPDYGYVVSYDNELKKQYNLPKTKIETDSYVAVQLFEKQKTLDSESIKFMAETTEVSFAYSILDSDNTLWLVRGDSPLSLIHIPKYKLYVYASTDEIPYKALVDTKLFDEIKRGKCEEIPINSGDILNILPDGTIVYDKFKYTDYSYFKCNWWDYGMESKATYIDDLKMVAGYYGYSQEDIDELLAGGFTPEEVEEYLYCCQ